MLISKHINDYTLVLTKFSISEVLWFKQKYNLKHIGSLDVDEKAMFYIDSIFDEETVLGELNIKELTVSRGLPKLYKSLP